MNSQKDPSRLKVLQLAAVALLAWGVPLLVVIVVRMITPDATASKDSFPSEVFTPEKIVWIEKKSSKRSSYFELWIYSPDGGKYFYRDPEMQPIEKLYRAIPQEAPLQVVFSKTADGNALLDIAPAYIESKSYLSFADTMAVYATRRRVVDTVAAIWFVIGSLLLVGFWMVDVRHRPA